MGSSPQTVLWEFGSLSPARTFVEPPPAPSRPHVICHFGTAQCDWDVKKIEIKKAIIQNKIVILPKMSRQ